MYFSVPNLISALPSKPCAFYSELPFSKGEQRGRGKSKAALVSDKPSVYESIHVVWSYFVNSQTPAFVPLFYHPTFTIYPAHLSLVKYEY